MREHQQLAKPAQVDGAKFYTDGRVFEQSVLLCKRRSMLVIQIKVALHQKVQQREC